MAGKEFAAAVVAAGVDCEIEEGEALLDLLARRGQFLRPHGIAEWPDGTVSTCYAFIHDLYREGLYDQVPVSRRVRRHQRIGAQLEMGYGSQARDLAAELAMHFVRGPDALRAVHYLQYAGEQALQRNAHQEAVAYLTEGLGTHVLPDLCRLDPLVSRLSGPSSTENPGSPLPGQ